MWPLYAGLTVLKKKNMQRKINQNRINIVYRLAHGIHYACIFIYAYILLISGAFHLITHRSTLARCKDTGKLLMFSGI